MVMSILTIILVVCGFLLVALLFFICSSLIIQCANQSLQDSEAARHFEPNSEQIRQPNSETNVDVSITHPTIQYEHEIKPNSAFRFDKPDGLARPVLPRVAANGQHPSNYVKPHLTLRGTVLPTEAENVNRQPNTLKPHLLKLAIKKHIAPACNTSAEAEQFSFERNKLYPTHLNTVFRVSPADFHSAILSEKQVIFTSPFSNTVCQSCIGCPV